MTTTTNQTTSIDVGIKHLALCRLVVDDDRRVSIADWRVVDLSVENPTSTTTTKCMRCKKRAAYTNGGPYSFCAVHVQQQTHWLTQKPYTQSFLQKQSVTWLQDEVGRQQDEVGRVKEKQEQVTKKDLVMLLTKAVEARMLRKVAKSAKAHDIPLVQLGRQLKRSLDSFEDRDGEEQEEHKKKKHPKLTHVVVENQISPIATRMKTLQGMLMQYYIMRCDDVEIACVSSSNKLSWLQSKSQTKDKEGQGYVQHKRDAVAWCRLLLASNPLLCPPHLSSMFETMKKKDDLADCLLQGLWYLVRELGVVMYDADTCVLRSK